MSIEQRYIDWVPRGESALGEWFEVRHAALGRAMSLCRLHETTGDAARNARLRSVATLHHPNIVAIVDADWDGATPYFVVDGIAERTLHDVLLEGRVPVDRALVWIRQLLRALHYAHQRGVHHGALAPSRVRLDAAHAVQLAEFGVTAAAADPKGHTVAIDSDAMAYLPLHVLRNPDAYEHATDAHAAAAIGFHLLLGAVVEGPAPAKIDGVDDTVTDALAELMQRDASPLALTRAIRALGHVTEPLGDLAQDRPTDERNTVSSAATIFEAAPADADEIAPLHQAPVRSSGTIVMSPPAQRRFESGAQALVPEGASADAIRQSLRHLEGMTAEGGATVIEGAHDDDDALANLREASGMVLDALGGEVDDHEQTPLAPQDDATDELQAGIQAAAAAAREARQRAQEALRRHAHLFGAAPERPQ